jgi:hypothetical protein
VLVCGSSLLKQTRNLSKRSYKICAVYGGQFCRLPNVVNIYCLIVFPAAKDFPFLTLFITDLKTTARSELLYNRSLLPSPGLSPCANTASFHSSGTLSDERAGRSLSEVTVFVGCICSQYRELNAIYTTQYIPELTNPWHAERFPWHAAFTAVSIFLVIFFCSTGVSIVWRIFEYI